MENTNNEKNYKHLVGKAILQALTDKGYSQTSFAEEMDMPISQINRYCLGKTIPSPELFGKIAKALELTPQELLTYSSDDEPNDSENAETSDIERKVNHLSKKVERLREELNKELDELRKQANTYTPPQRLGGSKEEELI